MPIATTFRDEGCAPVKSTDAERQRLFRRNNPEASRAIKARYMKNRGGIVGRERHLRERYGITIVEFNQMLSDQSDCCLICELPFGETLSKQPCVDHHHARVPVKDTEHRARYSQSQTEVAP